MKKQTVKDEHGYITNVGSSKYWGVTTSVVGRKRLWIVNIHPEWSDKTLKFRATNSYALSEIDAARIAAYLYDVVCFSKVYDSQYVLSSCGKWVYTVNMDDKLIRRHVYAGQQYHKRSLDEFFCEDKEKTIRFLESNEPYQLLSIQEAFDLQETKEDRKAREQENAKIVEMLDDLDKPTVYTERELIALITDGLLANTFTKTGARLLIGALEQVIYA